jgi:hypothetical protein
MQLRAIPIPRRESDRMDCHGHAASGGTRSKWREMLEEGAHAHQCVVLSTTSFSTNTKAQSFRHNESLVWLTLTGQYSMFACPCRGQRREASGTPVAYLQKFARSLPSPVARYSTTHCRHRRKNGSDIAAGRNNELMQPDDASKISFLL